MTERREFDIAVVGAGPAGLAAACEAAASGLQVVVLDNSPWLGGQIWRGEQEHPTKALARRWIDRFLSSGASLFSSATVFATPSPHTLLAETARETFEIRWGRLIVATGARELFVPFPGWTLPGVVGAGGLQVLTKAGWPVAGRNVVVAGSGPLLLAAADEFKRQGANVVAVAEQAERGRFLRFGMKLWRHPAKLAQGAGIRARLLGTRLHFGTWPVRAEGDAEGLRRVVLTDGRRPRTVPCDVLACAFHLVPNLDLPLLLGCSLDGDAVLVNEFQETSVHDVFCAGEPTGIGGVDSAIAQGRIAGLGAAGREKEAERLFAQRDAWSEFRFDMADTFAPRPELRALADADTVVCRCEDVRRSQMEGQGSWRAARLHTRCGMGPCQGRVCGSAAKFMFGWGDASVRPPLYPVRMGSLAGTD